MYKLMRNPVAYMVFVLPTLFLYSIFYLYPLLSSIGYGFTSYDVFTPPVYVGFDNFTKAFHDEDFWRAVVNNSYFILFAVFVQIPIIVIIAILISEIKRFRGFYKSAVFLPSVLSTAIVGILWSLVVYDPSIGLLSSFLKVVGLESLVRPWLADETTAMLAIMVTNSWQWTGFYVILVLAAIVGIPSDLYEAAMIDGATTWQKVKLITVPLIRPVLTVIILLSITGAMKVLDIIWVMTRGGPYKSTDVLGTYMYRVGFLENQAGYSTTVAILMIIFTLIIMGLYSIIESRLKGDWSS